MDSMLVSGAAVSGLEIISRRIVKKRWGSQVIYGVMCLVCEHEFEINAQSIHYRKINSTKGCRSCRATKRSEGQSKTHHESTIDFVDSLWRQPPSLRNTPFYG